MRKRSLLSLSCIVLALLPLGGCGSSSSSSSTNYSGTIDQGRAAVEEVMEATGASSISLAFIDGGRVVWAETFGVADASTMAAPAADTMYCIGSTSKMVAAISVMKLVDQGLISLDAPLKNYIASFSMLSPEYNQITVRMLLNHSAGFPGTDYRNAETSSPLPFSLSTQVLQTLQTQQLKHAPGYMSVYSNDGFTIIEQLVAAVSGKSYVRFVQDEIFDPLGMAHSRYPLDWFTEGSYAKRYAGDEPMSQLFLNSYGSGGLYSTPSDMAQIALMVLGKGALGNTRILSEAAVAEMGIDQTAGNFNPIKAYTYSYGLGWDTVVQPGLGAVGVTGWQKGGDVTLYGSVMTLAPEEGLAVVVMGASNGFGSGSATQIAERILLSALVEKGRITALPSQLEFSPRPPQSPTLDQLNAIIGFYANNDAFMRVEKQLDNSLNLDIYDAAAGSWQNWKTGLSLRDDDLFSSDDNPSLSFSFVTADSRHYLAIRYPGGYGHYQDTIIYAQKISAEGIPDAWTLRLGKLWLLTNDHPDSPLWAIPHFQLTAADNQLFADRGGLQILNPRDSDTRASKTLLIPQIYGRDLDDVVMENRTDGEWLRIGSYLYRTLEAIPTLGAGSTVVDIGAEGLAEWRIIDATVPRTVDIDPSTAGGAWKIYNSDFQQTTAGDGAASLTLPSGYYYLLFHDDANITVH